MEDSLPDFLPMEFVDLDRERVAVHQIPCIASQLSIHILYESGRSVEPKLLTPSQRDAHDSIKADEVVHVRMGNEDVVGSQQTGGTQGIVLSQVEEQRALRPSDFHIHTGIAETVVHEVAGERGGHEGLRTLTRIAPHYTPGRLLPHEPRSWHRGFWFAAR